jgi:hypothetical protein
MGVPLRRAMSLLGCCAALWLSASVARADRVYLVGGSVIEGKVTRAGDKIVIALDAGNVRLNAATVVRIERGDTAEDRIAARRKLLEKDDVTERLVLADECRELRLTQCERELLREILALNPEHREARGRLGYVRTKDGWVTLDEAQRAYAAANAAGAAERAAAVRKAELERDAAELARQQAALNVQAQRLALQTAQARAREEAARQSAPVWYGVPYFYSPGFRPRPTPPIVAGPQPQPVFTTPQPAFSINGVRHPASYFP